MVVAGASSVAAMLSLSTAISSDSVRVSIRRDERVLGDRPHAFILSAEVNDRIAWRLAFPMHFHRRCADGAQVRIGAKGLERGDFSGARPAYAPRLLEDSGAPLSTASAAASYIVISAGGEQARKLLRGRYVVLASLAYRRPDLRCKVEIEQGIEIA